ncbi:AAA family ATPase [Streptomyces sp. NPDC059740]|uniref:AAA family ATPase n=1 Tax=Streptomyces sp. NPDC059740 TaxID=3346926 RepID=UPI00365DAF97
MGAPPSTASPRQPFVRHTELAVFRNALHHLGEGRNTFLVISGEPGSGKTRLLAEFLRTADSSGVRALSACCVDTPNAHPWDAFAPLLASRLADEVGAALAGGGAWAPTGPGTPDRALVAQALSGSRLGVRVFLHRCVGTGLVLLLDDFHLADPDSVELVADLMRSPLDLPLLLVLSHRPRQSPGRLRSALAHGVETGTVREVALRPLTRRQSAQILCRSPQDPEVSPLHRRSDGNPSYLLALLAEGVEPMLPGAGPARRETAADRAGAAPSGGEHSLSLLGETAALGPRERTVLHALTVLGDGYDRAALSRVARLPEEATGPALEELHRRDLLSTTDGRPVYVLRHPALRGVLHRHIAPLWRADAHRRAARLLAERGAGPLELAHHLEHFREAAGPGDLDLLERAAREALWCAPRYAVRWLRTALRVLHQDPAPQAAHNLRLSLLLACALTFAGELGEARSIFQRFAGAVRAWPCEARLSLIAVHVMVESLLGHHTEAAALGETPPGADSPEPVEAVMLYAVQGLAGLLAGRPPALRQGRRAVRVARAHEDPCALGGALSLLGLCQGLAGDTPSARSTVAEAAAVLDGIAAQRLRHHPEYLALLGRAELLLGLFDDARRHFERGVALLRAAGHRHLLPVLLTGLASASLCTGPLRAARQAAEEAEQAASELGADRLRGIALSLRSLATGWAGAGRVPLAALLAEQAARSAPPGSHGWVGESALVLSQVAWWHGEPGRALSSLVSCCGGPALPGLPVVLRPGAYELLTAASVAAGLSALPWADSAAAAAHTVPGPLSAAYALAARAHVQRSRGERAEAARLYREAAERFEQAGQVNQQARVLLLGAECGGSAALTGQARQMLTTARRLARRYGGERLGADAERLHSACTAGSGPGVWCAGPAQSLSVLTKREREVTDLAGTGIRTRDIAKALGVSPKTIDVHLTRIYRKLQVASRTELVRRLAEYG